MIFTVQALNSTKLIGDHFMDIRIEYLNYCTKAPRETFDSIWHGGEMIHYVQMLLVETGSVTN